MNFKPTPKKDITGKIKNYLLNGFIIRYDGCDETPLEVIDRQFVKSIHHSSNIGQCEFPITEKIVCSHTLLHEVVTELRDDYSVSDVHCQYSGCCQYSTHAVYLD